MAKRKKNASLADLLEAEADKLLANENASESQDSSLSDDVSTTSVENQNVILENVTMSDVVKNETETNETPVAAVESVSKKKLILDFIAANPSLEAKNKEIAAALVALGYDIKVEHVAAVKSQEKAKSKKEDAPKFDMSSFKQVFAMQKRLNDAGGIPAVETALALIEPLLVESGSIDNLKMILATLKEVEGM